MNYLFKFLNKCIYIENKMGIGDWGFVNLISIPKD